LGSTEIRSSSGFTFLPLYHCSQPRRRSQAAARASGATLERAHTRQWSERALLKAPEREPERRPLRRSWRSLLRGREQAQERGPLRLEIRCLLQWP